MPRGTQREEPPANTYLDRIIYTPLVLLLILIFKSDLCGNGLHINNGSPYDVLSCTVNYTYFLLEVLTPPFTEAFLWHCKTPYQ